MDHFLIFGTHPRLSLAEFLAVKPDVTVDVCGQAVRVRGVADWNGHRLMDRLGGTTKLGDIVGELATPEVTGETVAGLLAGRLPGGSLDFGWSVYGGGKGVRASMSKQAISFKKALKSRGVSSRWVTSKEGDELSPAAVAKLKLTTDGLDVCLLVDGETTFVGLTTNVQDADAWSLRDYGRPARDDKNGMLPPKLARMMVNLANVKLEARSLKLGTLLDPFCGSGTILMEAALATDAPKLIGSDIERKQVMDSERNTEWLADAFIIKRDGLKRFWFFQADARRVSGALEGEKIDAIVTEGWLGPLLRGSERQADLDKNAEAISTLWLDSLRDWKNVFNQGGVVVGVWPAFKTSNGLARVDLTEDVAKLGYRMIEPLEAIEGKPGPLLYSRPGQFVQRRIVILALDGHQS